MVGIWFYDQGECDKVEALLQRIVATFRPAASEAAPALVSTPRVPWPGNAQKQWATGYRVAAY